ncbi:unnamed protein product [Closterium sp. NIES-53]
MRTFLSCVCTLTEVAAHQRNLWPRVSLLDTSPTVRWMGKVGDALVFRVWGSHAFVRDTSADKLSSRTIPCVFLGFPPDDSCLAVLPPLPLPHCPPGRSSSLEVPLCAARGAVFGGAEPPSAEPRGAEPASAEPRGAEPASAEPGGVEVEGAEPGGVECEGAESGGAEPVGAEPGGAEHEGAEPRGAESEGAESGAQAFGVALQELEALPLEALELEELELETLELDALPLEAVELEVLKLLVMEVLELLLELEVPELLELLVLEVLILEILELPELVGLEALELETVELEALELEELELNTLALEALELEALELEALALQALELEALELETLELEALALDALELEALELKNLELEALELETLEQEVLALGLLELGLDSPPPAPSPYAEQTDSLTESECDCPPSIWGECALGTDVREDTQKDFECLAAVVPHLVAMFLAPQGDPDASDIPTPRTYAEAITGPYSSQWQIAMDAEMASWKSTATYVDVVPPSGASIVDGMWIFLVKRPPSSPPVFKARYVARGFSQRQGVDFFQTFSPTPKMTTLRLRCPPGFTGSFPLGTQWSLRQPVYGLRQAPREWHDTLRTTLAALGFAPSTADPSLFLRTNTSLPPFYVLVYVHQLVFATADTEALASVKSKLQKRLTCTHLDELSFSALAPPSDESVELSGLYPELVGCLRYQMTFTRPYLAYPLSILAPYVAPGRHRPEH